jgi:hypothetical protein
MERTPEGEAHRGEEGEEGDAEDGEMKTKAKKKLAPKRPHWYHITITECPLCSRGDTYRERRYGTRPKSEAKRRSYEEIYDYCDAR